MALAVLVPAGPHEAFVGHQSAHLSRGRDCWADPDDGRQPAPLGKQPHLPRSEGSPIFLLTDVLTLWPELIHTYDLLTNLACKKNICISLLSSCQQTG